MERPVHILYICSGNICRSPMAEGVTRRLALSRGIPLEVRSAGVLGLQGRPAHDKAISVCREIGVDISTHRSGGVDEELLGWADHLLVMEPTHAAHLREFYTIDTEPQLLGFFAGLDTIADPIGGWTWTYRRIRKQIERSVHRFLDEVADPSLV